MLFRVLTIAIPFIWFGLLGGISFLEAPLEFQAPGVTLGLGLGIGRLVFGVMNKIEISLGIVLLVSFLVARPKGKFPVISLTIILLLLVLETLGLLPLLDERAQAVIDGTGAPLSNMHVVYIVFDVIKFLLLFALGVVLTKRNLKEAV